MAQYADGVHDGVDDHSRQGCGFSYDLVDPAVKVLVVLDDQSPLAPCQESGPASPCRSALDPLGADSGPRRP